MKAIIEARKLYGVEKNAELKELKSLYRNFMKEWHPDKFHDNPDGALEAEAKSKQYINAYHLLVSIAPETHAAQLEEYTNIITSSRIVNFQYKGQTLKIDFLDNSSYEYFGVPKSIYSKLVNSDIPDRFARRHIYHSFLYRNLTKAAE